MAKTFTKEQQKVFNYLKEITHEGNILENLTEVAEGFESVPDDIWNAYDHLSKMEYVEVIYKLSEGLILKNLYCNTNI